MPNDTRFAGITKADEVDLASRIKAAMSARGIATPAKLAQMMKMGFI